MKNYLVGLVSERLIEFSSGTAYLVQFKEEIIEKEFLLSKDACYLNFPFNGAEKIIPLFQSLKSGERNRIMKVMNDSYGFKVRIDDFFGKFLVVLFYKIELHNLVIVGLAGLGNNSIDTCIQLLKSVVSKEKSKVVILTKTASQLNERISVNAL